MTTPSLRIVGLMVTMLSVSVALHAQTPAGESSKSAAEDTASLDASRVAVDVARDRAKLMHDIYTATLDVMHHRYFHADRAVVPARAMEDVFAQIQRKSKTEARWISVNLKPMSLDHEPETKFEKEAARTLAKGKPEIEIVEDGFYRRATPVPLTGGCISCHGGFFRNPSKTPKYAGLVISVPVHGKDTTSPPETSED